MTDVVVDVSKCQIFKDLYDLTGVFQGMDSDADYRDLERNLIIMSIGKSKATGKVYGSPTTYFYQPSELYECVWLR